MDPWDRFYCPAAVNAAAVNIRVRGFEYLFSVLFEDMSQG